MAHFRVAARTLLHLGAELISSDAIALYELIKNAFDARSKEVHINVIVCMPYTKYKELRAELLEAINEKSNKKNVNEFRDKIINAIDSTSLNAKKLRNEAEDCNSLESLMDVLDSANSIIIKDTGEGMSLKDLEEIYLTIGTRSRYKQKEQARNHHRSSEEEVEESIQPILGEKGVGRLSAMRLGHRLEVKTKKAGEKYWNYLNIDWTQFSHDTDQLLESVDAINLNKESNQVESSLCGTEITITGLNSSWSLAKLEEIARDEFSKLTDPFIPKAKYPIKPTYNDQKVRIPAFETLLPEIAHAYIEAHYSINNGMPSLSGKVDYLLHHKSKKFNYQSSELKSICGLDSFSVLNSLGPFRVMFYWFNRRLLRGIDGIGNQIYIRNLVAQWSGGLMVFRDGFRINPYGGENNDWLDLDKKAFATTGYKLNRRQVIGKVDISSNLNPKLKDQTNREGLQNNDEFAIMRLLLQFIFFDEFKAFTDFIDKELKMIERVSFKVLEARLEEHENKIYESVEKLINDYKISRNAEAVKDLKDAIENVKDLLNKAKDLSDIHEDDKSQYLHLASLGLMAEIIAHELNRTTSNVLNSLKDMEVSKMPIEIESQLNTLSAQIRTLQKRLRILDPMSTRGRQVKETFDLIDWVDVNVNAHKLQFSRHNIKYDFIIKPHENAKLMIKAVKGMIVQILENLIDNSIYWIKEYRGNLEKKSRDSFIGNITITIDTKAAKLIYSDNGPGIPPDRIEEVFRPFYSTKSFKKGKGLGLFISREIAEYNNIKLYLSNKSKNNFGTLNTFVLELENIVQ